MSDWEQHPGGLRSRPLPDRWPAFDQDHGFTAPFTVDARELGSSETLAVCPTIQEAARVASRALRQCWRGTIIEITDSRNRYL